MSDTLKQIADNLGASAINGSYLSGIADHYGVDLTTSTDLMADILTEVGGDPATSTDYLKDIVLALGGAATVNANWLEAWEAITSGPGVPVNTVAPALDVVGDRPGHTITTDDGSWTNSPTSFTYQWMRVPETGGANDPIIGETANSYLLQVGDEDYLVTCDVTAVNGVGPSVSPASSDQCYVYDGDYFTYVYTNGYDGSTAQSYLQNRLMMGLKTSGAYAKLDYFNLYAIDGQGSALINWVDGSADALETAAVFIPDQGYDTGVNAGYIETNFNLSTEATHYTLNNASRYVFPYALTAGPLDGLNGPGNNMNTGSTIEQRINQGSNDLPIAFDYTTTVEPKSIHRIGANTVKCYNNLTSSQFTIASTSIENDTQVSGASDGLPGELVIAAYALGASMVGENTAFIAAYDAYINAI